MAAPPLVFDFIGVVFTAILYGFYCLLFGIYWRIQLRRADRWNGAIFYALTVNFILCTAYFIITIIQVQLLIAGTVLEDDSFVPAYEWMIIAVDLLYTAIDSISQLVLLYRCWIMWRKPLVMVIPCILSFSFLVIALATIGVNIKHILNNIDDDLPPSFYSAVTAFFCCGHIPLNGYLHRINKSDTDKCQKCDPDELGNTPPETVNHYLFDCPAHAIARDIFATKMGILHFSLADIMINTDRIKDLVTFINRTKRFKE